MGSDLVLIITLWRKQDFGCSRSARYLYVTQGLQNNILTTFALMRMTSAQLVLVCFPPPSCDGLESFTLKLPSFGARGLRLRSHLSPQSLHTTGQLRRLAGAVSSDETRQSTGDSEPLPGSRVTQTASFLPAL